MEYLISQLRNNRIGKKCPFTSFLWMGPKTWDRSLKIPGFKKKKSGNSMKDHVSLKNLKKNTEVKAAVHHINLDHQNVLLPLKK